MIIYNYISCKKMETQGQLILFTALFKNVKQLCIGD